MQVSIDVGYGFTKALSGSGGRSVFPSAVSVARGSGDLAKALGGGAQKHRLSVQVKSDLRPREYLVGTAALSAGASRSWDTSGSGRDDYLGLVLAALGAIEADGPVDVALGLPLAVYLQRDERRALRDRVAGLSAWVSWDGRDARRVEILSVKVLPQAVGAYYSALISANGERLAGQMVGVIDVGYHTTDYLLMTPGDGGMSVPDEGRSGSLDAGMSQAIDAARVYVSEQTGVPFAPPEGMVEATLGNGGHLTVRGRDIDLRPAYDAALRELAGRVEAELQRVWGDRIDYLAALLLAGGGGAAVATHLNLPGLRVLADPAFANAAGFLAMLARTQGQAQRGAMAL